MLVKKEDRIESPINCIKYLKLLNILGHKGTCILTTLQSFIENAFELLTR